MPKHILIVGAGREQIQAYKTAKNMGLKIVGTDIDPNAPGFKFTDYSLICSTRNIDETLKTVIDFNKKYKLDGVFTIANDAAQTVAALTDSLNLPGISTHSAKLASNKDLMKNKFKEFSIPTPNFHIVKTYEEFIKKIPDLKFPLVLKPSDGRGSRGVLLIDDETDLMWAWSYSMKNSETKILLLEKFELGDQLSVEGIFIDKCFHPIAFSDRNYFNLSKTKPFIVEDGGVIPSKYKGKILDDISKLIQDAALSLQIDWGTVKADIVLSKNGPKIIEIAARLSGNYLASHQIPLVYGYDIISSIIRLSLGESIPNILDLPKPKCFLGVRYFFPISGKIKDIIGVEKIQNDSNVIMLELFRKIGDFQPNIESNIGRSGVIMCKEKTYENAIKIVDDYKNKVKFKIN